MPNILLYVQDDLYAELEKVVGKQSEKRLRNLTKVEIAEANSIAKKKGKVAMEKYIASLNREDKTRIPRTEVLRIVINEGLKALKNNQAK